MHYLFLASSTDVRRLVTKLADYVDFWNYPVVLLIPVRDTCLETGKQCRSICIVESSCFALFEENVESVQTSKVMSDNDSISSGDECCADNNNHFQLHEGPPNVATRRTIYESQAVCKWHVHEMPLAVLVSGGKFQRHVCIGGCNFRALSDGFHVAPRGRRHRHTHSGCVSVQRSTAQIPPHRCPADGLFDSTWDMVTRLWRSSPKQLFVVSAGWFLSVMARNTS